MDTPIIEKYYKEQDPMKRKAILKKAIESGEDMEANEIRKELWQLRYQEPSELGKEFRADGYLALWMLMEFNKNASNRLFGGAKAARKDLLKKLNQLKLEETAAKSELHRELVYKECLHMVRVYMELCKTDKSYNTTVFGIVPISAEGRTNKMKKDIYETAVTLPVNLKLEKELQMITDAAKEVYDELFSEEEETAEDDF